jgi:hypothetical protein
MSTTFELDYLESCAVAMLDYAESLGRPLHGGEKRSFVWILDAFEQHNFAGVDARRCKYLSELMVQMQSIMEPIKDRVRRGLFRSKSELAKRIELERELRRGLIQVRRELLVAGIDVKAKKKQRRRQVPTPLFDMAECG